MPGKIVLRYDDDYLPALEQYISENFSVQNIRINRGERVAIFTTEGKPDTKTTILDLKMQKGVKSVSPVYRLSGDGLEVYFTDEFVVKFKESVSQRQIDEMHKKYNVAVKEDPYQYLFEKTRQLLSVQVYADVLEIANAYQKSGLVVYSQPNFLAKVTHGRSLPAY